MKMKKRRMLTLAAVISAAFLTACGAESGGGGAAGTAAKESTAGAESSAAAAEETGNNTAEAGGAKTKGKLPAFDTSGTIAETGALESLGMHEIAWSAGEPTAFEHLTVLSEGLWTNRSGQTVGLLEVRNDGDEDRAVNVSGVTLNGLKVLGTTWSSTEITPGCTALIDVNLDKIMPKICRDTAGLGAIQNMVINLEAAELNSWDTLGDASVAIGNAGEEEAWSAAGDPLYDNGGITIWAVGKPFEDPDDSLHDHLYFAVRNGSGFALSVTDPYGVLSLGGIMTDYSMYSLELQDGETGLIDIQISRNSLEQNGITDPAQVTEAEMRFDLRQSTLSEEAEVKATY